MQCLVRAGPGMVAVVVSNDPVLDPLPELSARSSWGDWQAFRAPPCALGQGFSILALH